ncbi:uncharacterized protein BP01DRAFT_405213 [Aspergillus saccharolyticus JOP 1030-1]|uniref:Concanavalin A-like lectin/glucanase n=1 Tax=Aspergillus saccharolyticus JOP 1030-1 TaxID=1450539 RepID=A0A318Z730_9EURO|nr:hypothetical protein BP01DRAFT_405213 [Aspergillus saccharolyticus JOP 1030-1]PYH42244.1 hypothetical protein BP01DRAFT_405213 [Aspergillus saccharolyticus JOP 1030-1]
MSTRAPVLAAVVALGATTVHAAMGPAFSTGPVASNSWIREATSTLVLPNGPSGGATDAITSLWVGMGTSNGDLIQSIADNWQQKDWTMYAYTLMKTGDSSQMPIYGDGQADGTQGDQVTMHYKFDDASGNYTQTVLINGQTVSTLSTSDGHAQGWGSAVECAEDNCGTVGAHSWIDTKIILDVADPNYINTMAKGSGVTGEMSTTDGGKTWTVSTISIPEFSFGN